MAAVTNVLKHHIYAEVDSGAESRWPPLRALGSEGWMWRNRAPVAFRDRRSKTRGECVPSDHWPGVGVNLSGRAGVL